MTGLCYPSASKSGIKFIDLGKRSKGKSAFFMLPGKKTSMVKIEPLPPVRGKDLNSIIKIRIKNLYPGSLDGTLVSCVTFKNGKNKTAVLSFIKKTAAAECSNVKRCRGIIFPLQLIKRRDLKNTDILVAEYPDMIEIWELNEGIPEGYSRTGTASRYKIDNDKKYMILACTDRFLYLKGKSNIIIRNFRDIKVSPLHAKKHFPPSENKKKILTVSLLTFAFIISVLTFILETERKRITDASLLGAEEYLKKVKTMEENERGMINTVDSLSEKLIEYSNMLERAPYSVLSRLKNAAGTRTKIISFIWKDSGKMISISCSSENVLESSSAVRREFKNVRISGISVNDNGTGKYGIFMEAGR